MPMLEEDLRDFIVRNFLLGRDDKSLTRNTSFLDRGIIDSTGVMELVMFVETTYGIKIEDHDLTPQNLDSINSLAQYIQGKRAVLQ